MGSLCSRCMPGPLAGQPEESGQQEETVPAPGGGSCGPVSFSQSFFQNDSPSSGSSQAARAQERLFGNPDGLYSSPRGMDALQVPLTQRSSGIFQILSKGVSIGQPAYTRTTFFGPGVFQRNILQSVSKRAMERRRTNNRAATYAGSIKGGSRAA